MKRISLLFLILLIVGCQINFLDIKQRPTFPDIKKPVQPDYEKFASIEKHIEEIFSKGSQPLEYKAAKNPFVSAIDIYLQSQKIKDFDNPLAIPLDRIKLVGVMDSSVGRIGVVDALDQIFFVRVGDKIGDAGGVIIEITSTAVVVRETRRDIFGEYHTSIRELYITREDTL
jgi:Tfp pilus assembly protein PilP